MDRKELACILKVADYKIDEPFWLVDPSDILDAINTRQCMYCENTVEYSSGIFTCSECTEY